MPKIKRESVNLTMLKILAVLLYQNGATKKDIGGYLELDNNTVSALLKICKKKGKSDD